VRDSLLRDNVRNVRLHEITEGNRLGIELLRFLDFLRSATHRSLGLVEAFHVSMDLGGEKRIDVGRGERFVAYVLQLNLLPADLLDDRCVIAKRKDVRDNLDVFVDPAAGILESCDRVGTRVCDREAWDPSVRPSTYPASPR